MPILLRLLLVLAAGYVLVCVLVLVFQARLVYFPGPPPGATPAARGLEFRELELATSDGARVSGWFLPHVEARGAVLVSHGNAGNVEGRLELARAYLALGWAVLLYDYRGYGKSTGTPSEEGTYRDAESAYDWLAGEGGFAPERIALHGESLGVAVTFELALRRKVAGIVAESGFTSLGDMALEVYPFLPGRLLARIRYDNLAKVARLGVPLLVVHSPEDEIVPVEHARRLFAAAREPKRQLFTAGGHNDGGFLNRKAWRAEVGEFLESLVSGARAVER